ncbi:helix-turn-helix domain-containing protein [Duganella callida]|uniref:Helix-turn-helix domain-containing protein n=1 Tax=Duganella callida TaxID=2561932 RepID=A0A4Y9SKN9_9BURK|nr:helix-turn-helix domain-containing protein [Duganella callida]TFW27220.1 helix-turn-helix domain-containing protein [Duganella callida]
MNTRENLPLNGDELEVYEANRDLFAELLQGAEDIQAGLGRVVYSPLIAAREKTGLSYEEFARLLGISTLTLESWEQRREQPTKEASTLIAKILSCPDSIPMPQP